MARVFEDLDLPGFGQPFRATVMITLVDAITKSEVREAYWAGKTIIGSRRAPLDGNQAQWNQNLARAEWELDLQPNSEIYYKGYPGGTYWMRQIKSQTSTRTQKIKESKQYIEVPATPTDGRFLFPDLVVQPDVTLEDIDAVFHLTQGDYWSRTFRSDESLVGYTYEVELRRSPGSAVAATMEWDDVNAGDDPDFRIIGFLPTEQTKTLRGQYVSAVQQFDPDGNRKTLAHWLFNVGVDL